MTHLQETNTTNYLKTKYWNAIKAQNYSNIHNSNYIIQTLMILFLYFMGNIF